MTTKLSAKALTAMTNANGSTGRVPSTTDVDTLKELRDAGMIAEKDGLTRTGRIARDRHVSSLLEDLF